MKIRNLGIRNFNQNCFHHKYNTSTLPEIFCVDVKGIQGVPKQIKPPSYRNQVFCCQTCVVIALRIELLERQRYLQQADVFVLLLVRR